MDEAVVHATGAQLAGVTTCCACDFSRAATSRPSLLIRHVHAVSGLGPRRRDAPFINSGRSLCESE